MNKQLERFELYSKFIYIVVSILSMSSLLYQKVGTLYKILTVVNVCLLLLVFLKNYKNQFWDRRFIGLIGLLLVTQTITTVAHYNQNLTGNIIEIAFVFSYCMISAISNPKIQERLFKYVAYAVQVISFLSAAFIAFLIISRTTIFLNISAKQQYFYGAGEGRIWGFVNPNAVAIFSYISILTAVLLILKYRNKKHNWLKVNIVIQLFQFATQQSRGAMLSGLFMIVLYALFVSFEKKLHARLVKAVVYSLIFLGIVFGTNHLVNEYFNHFEDRVVYLDKNFSPYTPKEKKTTTKSKKLDIRLTESTPSGRTEIWKGAFKMGMNQPILGYGVRNVSQNFKKFFSAHLIANSLTGGNFHNIFVTVFVSGGLINLLAFILIIGYLSLRFLKYLLKGEDNYIKIAIVLFFGILSGQLFESTILYSTNFINFFFWLLSGHILYLMKKERYLADQAEEITDLEEIQKRELEILDYVKETCDKLGLKYFLAYGTLIGAIRHKGFIPWDDDVDLCMLRDDYEKLQDYLIANEDEKFGLMSYKNNQSYVYSFMKIYDKSTHLVERDVFVDAGIGLYIDIFPLDGYDDDESIRAKMRKLIKKRQLSCYTFAGIYNSKNVISTMIRNMFVVIYSFANARNYAEKIEKLSMSRRIEDYEYCDYVGLKAMKRPTIKKEWFAETIDVEFCGRFYKAPAMYDQVLRADYGDYMVLPPKDQQVTHHNFRVWHKKEIEH
ncbi:MAG: LicD family protein [Eubacteriales bacterium]|nr:LicD family protein [Eubacteriales bacterium]